MSSPEKLREHGRWLETHPWWGRAIALWFALAVLVTADLLKLGLDSLARWVSR
jgi:hypothetical protein